MQFSPLKVLREAIKAVPAVKYALGVTGIISAVAIVKAYNIDYRIATLGTLVMLILMTVLLVFAKLSTATGKLFLYPMLLMLWSFLALTIATATLIFTSVFFSKPVDLNTWITGKPETKITKNTADPISISGRVVSAEANQDLEDVSIIINQRTYKTDSRGNFNVEIPADQSNPDHMLVQKQGYRSQTLLINSSVMNIRIQLEKTQ